MPRNTCLILLVGLIGFSVRLIQPAGVAAAPGPGLEGTVTADGEGHAEGVLVSAKRVGSTVTVTVVSDEKGRYSFPAGRLQPGNYRLMTRAIGYDLADPGEVEVLPDGTAKLDLKLAKTRSLASQMMSAEWLMSVPGTFEEKLELYECVGCHSLQPVMHSRYDATQFLPVIERMRNHAPPSSFRRPNVFLPFKVELPAADREFVKYLSKVNRSSTGDGWSFPLKTFDRPRGKATRVVITQYDLPRADSMPHDAVVDKEGMVWYSEFSRSFVGRLDPRTGEVKEWPIPVRRPDFPEGSLDIQLDAEGNPWVGLLFQGGAAKLDRRTEKVTVFAVPPEHDGIKTRTGMVAISPTTGVVWSKASQDRLVHGFDPKLGKAIATHKIPPVGFYGMEADSRGNLVMFGLSASVIGVMDPATGKVDTYPTPTPNAAPRRGQLDSQDRAWFAEFYAGKIGMFDPKTKQIREWDLKTPWGGTYDAVPDKAGEVWSGGMHTDYIFRLNPATGEVTKYLLPTLGTNIRRMDVDDSASRVAVWIGENHHGKLTRLEFLE